MEAAAEIDKQYPTDVKLKELRAFLMQTVKTITSNATGVMLHKKLPAKVEIADNMTRSDKIEQFPLSEFDLDSYIKYLKEDPKWLPEKLESDEKHTYFELKVKGKTYDKMKTGAKILCARIEKFNDSLNATPEEKEKFNKEQAAAFEKARKIKSQSLFICFEDFLYDQFYKPIIDSVMRQGDQEIDADFEELYKVETPKS